MEKHLSESYIFMFEYEGHWAIICYKPSDTPDVMDVVSFDKCEDDYDTALEYVDLLLDCGATMYYYDLPTYDLISSLDIYDLENAPIAGLENYRKKYIG